MQKLIDNPTLRLIVFAVLIALVIVVGAWRQWTPEAIGVMVSGLVMAFLAFWKGMRRAAPLILFACLVAYAPVGCQSTGTPATQQASLSIEQQYQAASVTYQTAMLELIALRQHGTIDDNAYRQIEPWRQLAWTYLTQMQAAATTGQATTFNELVPAFNQAIANWAAAQPRKAGK